MTEPPLPFLQLVDWLRNDGFEVTPEQYAHFRQALALGFGSASMEDLRQLCGLLWVKPSSTYDRSKFDRIFNRFLESNTPQVSWRDDSASQSNTVQGDRRLGVLPAMPPRQFPDQTEPAAPVQVPTAIATPAAPPEQLTPPIGSPYRLTPIDLPISHADIHRLWTSLKRPTRISRDLELDIDATIAQMERQGADCAPVLRPLQSRRAQLLIFFDTNAAMIPFHPIVQPLLESATTGRITPAQVYRFTTVPLPFVYPWQRPVDAEPLDRVLSLLHRQRTIAIILSDAGAASRIYNHQRVLQTQHFLEQLAPCVQQLIWLNPLPQDRWHQSSAIAIAQFLDGRMYPLTQESLTAMVSDRHRSFLPTAQPVQVGEGS